MAGAPMSAPATSKLPPLTRPSLRVLVALSLLLEREGSASIREVMLACGHTSTSTVAHHLRKLATDGYIEPPIRNRPRGWRLTREGWIAVGRVRR